MAFIFSRKNPWGNSPQYINTSWFWTQSKAAIAGWTSSEEALQAYTDYLRGYKDKSKWSRKDTLKWMIESDIDLEFL